MTTPLDYAICHLEYPASPCIKWMTTHLNVPKCNLAFSGSFVVQFAVKFHKNKEFLQEYVYCNQISSFYG